MRLRQALMNRPESLTRPRKTSLGLVSASASVPLTSLQEALGTRRCSYYGGRFTRSLISEMKYPLELKNPPDVYSCLVKILEDYINRNLRFQAVILAVSHGISATKACRYRIGGEELEKQGASLIHLLSEPLCYSLTT